MSLKVNGKAYDWGDVDLKIPGLAVQVQEISYDDEMDMEETYGRGSKPRGYGTGNYKASGKLSLLRDDYDDLLAYCKAKGTPFYKMEFPSIIVAYANDGGRTVIDELKKDRRAQEGQTHQTLQQSGPGRQEPQGRHRPHDYRRHLPGWRRACLSVISK